MSRRSSTFFVLAALAGAVATGFLVLQLLDDGSDRSGSREGYRDGGGARAGGDHNPQDGGGGTNVAARRSKSTRSVVSGGVQPNTRKPWDSPLTKRQRSENSERVKQILEQIMRGEGKRWELHRELQKLLQQLGEHVDPSVRGQLLEMLTTVDPQWRPLIGDALGSLKGDPETARALVDLLERRPDSPYTRTAIYNALTKMGAKMVLPRLKKMLGDGHEDERLIVRVIGELGGKKEASFLLDRLNKPLRPATRREIEAVLRKKAALPGFMDAVSKGLSSSDPKARRSVVTILASSKDPKHAKAVRALLRDESDPETRRAAIRALGKFGDQDSAKELLRIAESSDTSERRRAVQAMHFIQNRETIEMLADEWGGLGQDGRLALMGAAARVPSPGDKLNELARSGLSDESIRVRTASALLMGRPTRDDNVQPISTFIHGSKDPSEWRAGLRALERIGTRKSAEEGLRAARIVPNRKERGMWLTKFEKILAKAEQREAAVRKSGR